VKAEGIHDFLTALGAKFITVSDRWVNCSCPLAPWTHRGKKDKHPSFGVTIAPDRRSYYQCFSCSPEGQTLAHLLWKIYLLSGEVPRKAALAMMRHENWHKSKTETIPDIPDPWVSKDKRPTILPQQIVDEFPLVIEDGNINSQPALDYLRGRAVLDVVVETLGVRFHRATNALVFPLTDVNGDIKVLTYSSIMKKFKRTVTANMAGFNPIPLPSIAGTGAMFGAHLVNWSEMVMIVESEADLLRLVSLGWTNVVALTGTGFTRSQIDAMTCGRVIIAFDSDAPGNKARDRFDKMTGNKFIKFFLDWSLVGAKDAGKLKNKEELALVLRNMSIRPTYAKTA
jgi:5S rRNA maturation endonuclease (ribonuclease M5)